MLKSVDTTQTVQHYVSRKCAEVYLERGKILSFICSACSLKTFEFEDFFLHLQNVHLLDTRTNTEEAQDDYEHGDGKDMGDADSVFSERAVSEHRLLVSKVELRTSTANMNNSEESPSLIKSSDHSEKSEAIAESVPHIIASPKKPKGFKYKCSQCKNCYKIAANLTRHIVRSHNGQELCCEFCDKKFNQKASLRIHESTHNQEQKFNCNAEGCGKVFTTRRNLSRHNRLVHLPQPTYVCEMCGYCTTQKARLIVHRRSHTGERPYACKQCGKAFASSTFLRDHMPIHSTERPHKCEVCGAAFSRRKALYHHKHLHSEVKKFVCKLCGNAYAQMAGLAGHMRKHRENGGAVELK